MRNTKKTVNKRNYIGLATTPHDPALAIVNEEGNVVFAEATERYLQNKRALYALPVDVIRIEKLLNKYCNPNADIIMATSWSRRYTNYRAFHLRKVLYSMLKIDTDIFTFPLFPRDITFCHKQSADNLLYRLNEVHPETKFLAKHYNHHMTHAASACYSSPFNDAVCVVIDGFGEYTTTSVYKYNNGRISLFPSCNKSKISLGLFYDFVCNLCGFDFVKGEQWKVMGLASYGKFDKTIYRLLRPLITTKRCTITFEKKNRKNTRKLMIKYLKKVEYKTYLEYADLAHTAQYIFNEIVISLLQSVCDLQISRNLVLSGGCALNSTCNGMILGKTKFERLYIFCAPADDGNAVGAALLAYREDNPLSSLSLQLQTPYLGETMAKNSLDKLNRFSGLKRKIIKNNGDICAKTAEMLSEGKIIGWVQGRAEFGPRALGNRSILADPRTAEMKDKLNDMVKFREEFRPFAPSILHEFGSEYFENYQESPYMERTLKFRKEIVSKVPAVVHIDGTGRLQTVKAEWNQKYYNLIKCFYKITGIPLLLNTSFNVMSKPIIHSVEDAIAVFMTSGLDALVIEDNIYVKK